MSIFRFSNAGGFGTYQRYNDFLAGNPTTPVITDFGSMFPLGEFTLASDQSEVNFTNIPQTYTHLQLRIIGRDTQAGGAHSLRLQFNNDTGSNYTYHAVAGDGSSASSGALTSLTSLFPGYLMGAGGGTGTFSAVIIDILDYRNNKNKVARTLSGADNNGSGNVGLHSGLWISTNAITSIKLLPAASTNFTTNSMLALYGVL